MGVIEKMKVAICTTADLTGWLLLLHCLPWFHGHAIRILLAQRRREIDRQWPLRSVWHVERTAPLFCWRHNSEDRTFPSHFHALAARHGVSLKSYHQPQQWRGGVDLLDDPPDLLLTMRFGFVLTARVLAAIPEAYNFHPGALPDYAGQYPVLWALLDRVDRLHCTVHQLTPHLDGGPVVAVGKQEAPQEMSHFMLRYQCYLAGFRAWRRRLPNTFLTPPQPVDQWHSWPDERALTRLRTLGHPLMTPTDYADILGTLGLSANLVTQISNDIPPTARKNFGLLD